MKSSERGQCAEIKDTLAARDRPVFKNSMSTSHSGNTWVAARMGGALHPRSLSCVCVSARCGRDSIPQPILTFPPIENGTLGEKEGGPREHFVQILSLTKTLIRMVNSFTLCQVSWSVHLPRQKKSTGLLIVNGGL